MNSLAEHLSLLSKSNRTHGVLGNESGDLDSVASALCYSLLKGEEKMIPFLNFPKKDLFAKKELMHLLTQGGISPDALYFKEDLERFSGSLTLVDHRRLAVDQQNFRPRVRSVVDHHPGQSDPFSQPYEEEIVICGSTASIISSKREKWPHDAASFLLGAILLDTSNLEDRNKTTEFDRKAVLSLSQSTGIDRRSFYEELLQLKEDVADEDLLKRDAKSYKDGQLIYAISSVPRTPAFDREAWEKFRNDRAAHALFVFVNKAEAGTKHLFLYAPDDRLLDQMTKCMPFPVYQKEGNVAEFLCPEELSRKTLQPLFSFSTL